MNNPIQTIKSFMNNGGTPQQFIQQLIKNNTNPMLNDLLSKAQKGDSKSLEDFARNVCKEQGRDFDKEFSEFMSYFK